MAEEYNIKNIGYLAILFGVGVIVASIMGQIVGEYKTGYDSERTALTATNESNTLTVGTPGYLGDNEILSVTAVRNNSGVTLASGEYTLLNAGELTSRLNITNTSKGGTTFYVDYTYQEDDAVFNSTNKGLKGQLNMSNWFTTVGLVLGAVLILGALGSLFYLGKK